MSKSSFDRSVGVDEKAANYLVEAFMSPGNQALGLGGLLTSMGIGFFVGGPAGALAAVGVIGLDVMYNFARSQSVSFQYEVDQKIAREHREQTRQLLLSKFQQPGYASPVIDNVATAIGSMFVAPEQDRGELDIPWLPGPAEYRSDYYRMREQIASLRELSLSSGNNLSEKDIERLEEVTLDFLRLIYSLGNLRKRIADGSGKNLKDKIAKIEETLKQTGIPETTRRQLKDSLGRLQANVARRAALPTQETSYTARLMTMAEDFSEVYHQLSADPSSATSVLADMTERLNVEAELAMATELDIMDMLSPSSRASSITTARDAENVERLENYRRAAQAAQTRQ